MRRYCPVLVLAFAAALAATAQTPPPKDVPKDAPTDAPKDEPKDARKDAPSVAGGFLNFREQPIDRSLKVGYAVIVADVNADGKPDIVVVDTDRVLWYENPSWKPRTIIQGQTKLDNVSITAADIDGDGQLDFALA